MNTIAEIASGAVAGVGAATEDLCFDFLLLLGVGVATDLGGDDTGVAEDLGVATGDGDFGLRSCSWCRDRDCGVVDEGAVGGPKAEGREI
ncbi:hypothetical protein ACFX1T_022776 [Malus domestica]